MAILITWCMLVYGIPQSCHKELSETTLKVHLQLFTFQPATWNEHHPYSYLYMYTKSSYIQDKHTSIKIALKYFVTLYNKSMIHLTKIELGENIYEIRNTWH